MRSILLNIALITIIWLSLLAVLVSISTLILPIINEAGSTIAASIARVTASLVLFLTWLVWWIALAYFWFYRVLGGGRNGGSRS